MSGGRRVVLGVTLAVAVAVVVVTGTLAGCSGGGSPGRLAGQTPSSSADASSTPPSPSSSTPSAAPSSAPPSAAPTETPAPSSGTALPTTDPGAAPSGRYPLHTSIVATTFWVGEVFDPDADDGSQVLSTYDDDWMANYGGCDGREVGDDCRTERRTAANGFFPNSMTPRQNPFYLDLPFDDVNDPAAAARRAEVVPWAHDPGYAEKLADPDQSIMKDRWVAIRKDGRVCYGQIQDAGPGEYDDAEYVFGTDDARPANDRYNGAGMDVSPALNGCLGFSDLNGEDDRVDWWFVDDGEVPPGPWLRVVTGG